MGLISKTFTLACAFAGLAGASQLPEFTQQYRQRLAGAVEELRVVVADFDKDAQTSGLTRNTALEKMIKSTDAFPRERGASMARTVDRFQRLEIQQNRMETAEPVSRPLFLFSTYDEKLLKGSWQIFEPAVPLNAPGAVWGGFGAFLFGFLARIPIGLMRVAGRKTRSSKDPYSDSNDEVADNIRIAPDLSVNAPSSVALPRTVAMRHVLKPQQGSLLDQIALEERVVGEVDAQGHLVTNRSARHS